MRITSDNKKAISFNKIWPHVNGVVRERRLELLYLSVPDPKSGASANSATLANLKRENLIPERFLARPVRLERTTYGLEGRCSIQLSYGRREKWSGRQDSNLRPPVPKTGALPGCATPRRKKICISHLLNSNQAFDCRNPIFTRYDFNASAAMPLWLIPFLTSRDSSASVFPYSGTMKRGS